MTGTASPGAVVVVGSINLDEAIRVPALPRPGETVIATTAHHSPGGKGANQAVAAARAGGAHTTLIGSLGNDEPARVLRAALAADDIDAEIFEHHGTSGRAVVLLADNGENSIAVVPGANSALTSIHSATAEAAVHRAGAILMQLETPHELLEQVGRLKNTDSWLILNAAPAIEVDARLWEWVDLLVVNEHEAASYTGATDARVAAATLLERVSRVVVTLGAEGSLYMDRAGVEEFVPAERIRAVDTTAAGDTYCGVLAAGLSRSLTVRDAMENASRAAALTALAQGAQDSIPTASAVLAHFGP